jgi:hypothetical protein
VTGPLSYCWLRGMGGSAGFGYRVWLPAIALAVCLATMGALVNALLRGQLAPETLKNHTYDIHALSHIIARVQAASTAEQGFCSSVSTAATALCSCCSSTVLWLPHFTMHTDLATGSSHQACMQYGGSRRFDPIWLPFCYGCQQIPAVHAELGQLFSALAETSSVSAAHNM